MAEIKTFKDPEIIRTGIIVVANTSKTFNGDLIATDKEGQDYKIGNKRSHLFGQFVPGRAVQVGYAAYMGTEYIATAKLVEIETKPVTHETTKEQTSPVVEEAKKMGAKVIGSTDDTKLRSMAIAYAKDLVVAGVADLKDMTVYADKFLAYILNIK